MKKINPYKNKHLRIVNDSYRTPKQLMFQATISACIGMIFGIISCIGGHIIYFYFFQG